MNHHSRIPLIIRSKLVLLLFSVLLGATTNSRLQAQPHPLDAKFDAYVEKALRDWKAPGVVISVVKDGEHIFAKGYGTRKLGENLRPDKNTLVTIASCTKAFTAAALAILMDEGKLSWDDPVKKHISEFQFSDGYVTQNATIRDLLVHRIGFPNAPGGFNKPDYKVSDLLTDLRASEPTTGFRERLNYSQVGFALAGEVVARVSGMSWDEFVTERILQPLGMSSSYATPARLKESLGDPNEVENIFIRALKKEGKVISDEWFGFDYLYAPAGAIITTSVDIAKWMILQLQGGEYNGKRLISAEACREMRNPQMVEDIDWARRQNTWWAGARNHFAPLIAYGLGWWSFDYEGRRIDEHWGAGAGSTVLAIVPDENLGVFVTTNAAFPNFEGNHMVDAIKFKLISLFTGAPERDWSTEFLKTHKRELETTVK